MKNTSEREIGGLVFEVTEESFTAGKTLLILVGKVAGPAILKVLAGAKSVSDVGPEALMEAATKAIEDLTEDRLNAVEDLLAKSTRVFLESGKKPFLDKVTRESVFSGSARWVRYFGWLQFALEVNLRSFFDLLTPRAPAP